MKQRLLEVLHPDECRRLLATRSVGRLVYIDEHGPAAVPVNYAYAGGGVVIRVEGGMKRDAMAQDVLAFEVDDIDEATHEGWSVLVRGRGREVPLEDVPGLLHASGHRMPEPWAYGVHNTWLQLTPASMSGRRLGSVKEHAVY